MNYDCSKRTRFLLGLSADDTANAALAQCTSLEDVQLTAAGMGYGFSVDELRQAYASDWNMRLIRSATARG